MAGELDGFYATWQRARGTYGQGTPVTGERFDASSTLNALKSDLAAAVPADRWTGSASEAYGDANTRHQQLIGRLADLDTLLSTQVTNAANIVTAGRTDLDELHKWVTDAAATTTDDEAGRTMRLKIASQGLGQLTEIMTGSHDQLETVKGNIDRIAGEYDRVKDDTQFLNDDGEPENETPEEKAEREAEETRQRAEQDVQDALAGDVEAAGRVDGVLDQIEPGVPLTAEQGSYLSQMQAQMHGMSVERVHEVGQQLGDHEDVVGDAMQLMSDDDVRYPQTDREVDALDDPSEMTRGGFDRLPTSVQETLNSSDILHMDRLDKQYPGGSMDRGVHAFDPTISKVFDAVSPDHGAIHDAITNGPGHIEGIDSDRFMEGATHRHWADDGKAAGQLFEWTRNSTGPEAMIAAETAHAYATYLGDHSREMLSIGEFRQIGDVSPALVQAFSTGLLPYQEEMIEDQPRLDSAFEPLDDFGGRMDTTEGLFAVIDSQPDAAREWNRAAYQLAMDKQESFADFAKESPELRPDKRGEDLQSSARMLAIIDGGVDEETLSNIENGHMGEAEALENASAAHNFKRELLADVLGYGTAADVIMGEAPNPNKFTFDESGVVTDIGLRPTEQALQHQFTQAQYAVAKEFIAGQDPHIDPEFFNTDGSLKSPSEISAKDWSDYHFQITVAVGKYGDFTNAFALFRDTLLITNGYTR